MCLNQVRQSSAWFITHCYIANHRPPCVQVNLLSCQHGHTRVSSIGHWDKINKGRWWWSKLKEVCSQNVVYLCTSISSLRVAKIWRKRITSVHSVGVTVSYWKWCTRILANECPMRGYTTTNLILLVRKELELYSMSSNRGFQISWTVQYDLRNCCEFSGNHVILRFEIRQRTSTVVLSSSEIIGSAYSSRPNWYAVPGPNHVHQALGAIAQDVLNFPMTYDKKSLCSQFHKTTGGW